MHAAQLDLHRDHFRPDLLRLEAFSPAVRKGSACNHAGQLFHHSFEPLSFCYMMPPAAATACSPNSANQKNSEKEPCIKLQSVQPARRGFHLSFLEATSRFDLQEGRLSRIFLCKVVCKTEDDKRVPFGDEGMPRYSKFHKRDRYSIFPKGPKSYQGDFA